jgi:hypothetical protein
MSSSIWAFFILHVWQFRRSSIDLWLGWFFESSIAFFNIFEIFLSFLVFASRYENLLALFMKII